jgi:formylglycine-generating enzyme required for sulfatase activity
MTDELIGKRLGQYHLIEFIQRGGMSTVYKAHQPSLDRFVAVKVMLHNRDPQFAARFKREARAIAQLQHPNILPIYDYNEQDGLFYLVLQYVENGITLGHRMGAPMPPETALRLTSRLLSGLEYAHSRGIIHRDIKPGNVLMPSPDWPMLSDFGIAKLLNDTSQAQLTVPGLLMGTAAYIAPEQALSQPVDARTDLYSTGVMLYEMLTGRVPFDGDSLVVVMTQHVYEAPPPPSRLNHSIPPAVEQVVLRALAKKPDDRYQSAAEMAAALDEAVAQLRQPSSHSQLTGLYQAGVLAFAEGRWDQAVDQLGKLMALDPEYEDGADLLSAAQDARERAREEARQQMERVRQRRSTMAQVSPPTPATGETRRMESPPTPATGETRRMESPPATGATSRMTPPPTPATGAASGTAAVPTANTARFEETPAERGREVGRGDAPSTTTPLKPDDKSEVHARVAPSSAPAVTGVLSEAGAPPSPAATPAKPGGKRMLALIGGVVVILLALAGATFASGMWSGPTPSPTAAGPATAVSGAGTEAPAEPTTAPATSAPAQPTAPATEPAAPLPEPEGEVVLVDDFSEAGALTGLEDLIQDPEFSRGFHAPGVYHLIASNSNEIRQVAMPRRMYRDFTMQIDVWDDSDDFSGSSALGIIFRVRNAGQFYALLIDQRAGRYTVREHTGPDQFEDIIPWRDSPLVKRPKGEINTVRLDASGGTFIFSLNGQHVESFSDDSYAQGMLGMIIANGDALTPHMHFDNLTVWSNDQPPAASSLDLTRDAPSGPMVLIPGGEFILGTNGRDDSRPHIVALPDFYIDRHEVTNAGYAECVAAGACTPQASPSSETHPNYASQDAFANFPALHVNWQQANQFCQWAGKRLPSEAEWEKAASWSAASRSKSLWPFGDTFDSARLNSIESGAGDTTAVDQHEPELNGTHDMAGNASEWTSSLYAPYPYDPSDGREDPQADGERVYRGGSWAQSQGKALGTVRIPAGPEFEHREVGFRCAATP